MSPAGAGPADQHGIALLGDKAASGELTYERLVDRALELEVLEVLGEWQLGDGELVLDRARLLLADLGGVSGSSMMRCGSCCRLTAVAMISSKAAFMP